MLLAFPWEVTLRSFRQRLVIGLAFMSLSLVALAAVVPQASAQRRRGIPISIESTPAGAAVYLDAETEPLGTTPIRVVRVPRGQHTLTFKLESHEDTKITVDVRRRRETFRAELEAFAVVMVQANDDTAQSAAVVIDGHSVGNVPFRAQVQPGRHLVQVRREGFVTFSQWVDLAGRQVFTLPVTLEREAPETGSILVAPDVSGANVFLDSAPRGATPTVLENVPAGDHVIEIHAEGRPIHRETIRVVAGERLRVAPSLRAGPANAGTLRVISTPPGALVVLDGEALGNAPVTKEGVVPGEHILEASLEGYKAVMEPVAIESGQQRVVSLRLEALARTAGRIVVNSPTPGAKVIVDGEERGTPPVVVQEPTPGTHAIVVSAEGYQDHRQTCQTAPGRDCTIDAELKPIGTSVRVTSNAAGAQLFIDGELAGPVPFEGNVPVGAHRFEVRAPGHQPHLQQVHLRPQTDTRAFDIALTKEGALSEEERLHLAEERQRDQEGATSYAAAALPVNYSVLDMSLGWPHLAEVRLNVGILHNLEGGFAMRSFGRLTEFEGRLKYALRPLEQLSFGAQVKAGGGLGPGYAPGDAENVEAATATRDDRSVNTFFVSAEALGSLHFANRGAFTLYLGLDLTTDRYDWAEEESDCLVVPRGDNIDMGASACSFLEPGDIDPDDGGRQTMMRLRLGGTLELVINNHWNAWGGLEGILVGPERGRRILGDIYGFGNADTELYMRLGMTYKF